MSRTNTVKNVLATAYGADIATVSAHSTDPGSSGVNELTGGSPAYARKAPPTISAPTTGLITFQVVFDIPAGATVGGIGLRDGSGNYLDGGAVTAVTFASQGTYTATITYQQN